MPSLKTFTGKFLASLGALVAVACIPSFYFFQSTGRERERGKEIEREVEEFSRKFNAASTTVKEKRPAAFDDRNFNAKAIKEKRPATFDNRNFWSSVEEKRPTAFDDLSPCSDYASTVQIVSGPAGLGDRAFVIEEFGSLATWLCATLVVPPPAAWLTTLKHNYDTTLPPGVRWSDYLQTRRLADGASFLDETARRRPPSCRHLVSRTLEDGANVTSFRDTLKEAFRIRRANGCFWWELRGNVHTMRKHFPQHQYPRAPELNRFSRRCRPYQYVALSTSAAVQRAAIAVVPPKYDSLHIRRGDTVRRDCDRSVPAVLRYLAGAIDASSASTEDTLAVFTDETNDWYLNKLNRALVAFGKWNDIVWGDREIRARYPSLTENNNYMTYAIASTIIGSAQTQFKAGSSGSCKGTLPNLTYAICHPCARENSKMSSQDLAERCASCPKDAICHATTAFVSGSTIPANMKNGNGTSTAFDEEQPISVRPGPKEP